MKILLVHNFYQQQGGEDRVFQAEGSLLEEHGHHVIRHTIHNDQVRDLNKIQLARAIIWNKTVYQDIQELIRQERPHIAHFHNIFPLISPAAYYAVQAEGIPVLQTLHNYRYLCPNGILFRDGQVCEECVGKYVPWPGILHGCYRQNRVATAGVAAMLSFHRSLGTWDKKVNGYIALTEFTRQKFIEARVIRKEKIFVKHNYVHSDPGIGTGQGNFALFVGRLSPEKGLGILLEAWKNLRNPLRLKVVGAGPLLRELVQENKNEESIEFLGSLPEHDVLALMKEALVLIFPTLCFENLPLVILEAFATGLPVVGSDMGNTKILIRDRELGLLFRPNDPKDLSTKIDWLMENPAEIRQMRTNVRKEYELKYTSEKNYRVLLEIYNRLMENKNWSP